MANRSWTPTSTIALLWLAGPAPLASAQTAWVPHVAQGVLASPVPLGHLGIALLVLGLALFLAEALAPSFGVMGTAGVLAFVVGTGMLVDADVASVAVSLPLLTGVALSVVVIVAVSVRMALAVRRRRALGGSEGLIDAPARVLDWAASSGSGHVQVAGERWAATGAPSLQAGQAVRVRAVRGLVVDVVAGPPPSP